MPLASLFLFLLPHTACLPLIWVPTPATREPETEAHHTPCTHRLHASLIGPCSLVAAHTGYQTGKHSGNRSHSLSRQQGEEQHDLTLPAQNETGKRLPDPGGRGETGLGHSGQMTRLPCGGQVGYPQACTSTRRGCAGRHWALAASTSKSPGGELAG